MSSFVKIYRQLKNFRGDKSICAKNISRTVRLIYTVQHINIRYLDYSGIYGLIAIKTINNFSHNLHLSFIRILKKNNI